MIIYNVSVKPELSIAVDWLEWLKSEHIPDVLGTGCFIKAVILQMMDTDEAEGPTYAIQYFAENKEDVDRYLTQYAPEMRARGTSRWGNRFIAFRTIMKVIN